MKKTIITLLLIVFSVTCAFAGIWDTVKAGASSALNSITGKQDAYSMPEDDFKNGCIELSYSDMMNKVDENKGKFVVLDIGIHQNANATDYLSYAAAYMYGILVGINTNQPIWVVDALMKNQSLNAGSYFRIWGIYKGLNSVALTTGITKMPQIEVVYSTKLN